MDVSENDDLQQHLPLKVVANVDAVIVLVC